MPLHPLARAARACLPCVLACAGPLAKAQVKIIHGRASVQGGGRLMLRAVDPQRPPEARWDWQLVGARGAGFSPVAEVPGAIWFEAPDVAVPTWFRVQVSDPAYPVNHAQAALLVRPHIPGVDDYLFDHLLPSTLGQDWMHPRPWITPFPLVQAVGSPGAPQAEEGGTPFRRLRFAGPDGARRNDPAWSWLACGIQGLQSLDREGGVRQLWSGSPVPALALRPQADPLKPPAILFADNDASELGGDVIRILNPDLTTTVLAGSRLAPLGAHGEGLDGLGDQASFGNLTDMTMTRSGDVLVIENNVAIRRITPAGQTTTLPCRLYAPGREPRAPGLTLAAMAMDPIHGDLYVVASGASTNGEPSRILRVSPQGEMTTLFPPKAAAAEGEKLGQFIMDIQLRGRVLFILDPKAGGLQLFNLDTRRLTRGLGDPTQMVTRNGLPAFLFPDAPVQEAATLEYPITFDLAPGGSALMSLAGGELCEVDLSEVPLGVPPARPGQGPEQKHHAPARPGQGPEEKHHDPARSGHGEKKQE